MFQNLAHSETAPYLRIAMGLFLPPLASSGSPLLTAFGWTANVTFKYCARKLVNVTTISESFASGIRWNLKSGRLTFNIGTLISTLGRFTRGFSRFSQSSNPTNFLLFSPFLSFLLMPGTPAGISKFLVPLNFSDCSDKA